MDVKVTKLPVFLLNLVPCLLLGLIVGCSTDNQTAENNKKEPDANRIMLSADGVGPINASTPFNMHQMTRAFQDYSVTEYTQFQEGNSEPVIRISEDGKPLIFINPDAEKKGIFSVFVMSKKIGNALGHEIGSTYNKIYNYGETEPCIPGTEEFSGKVICIAPKTQNLLYVFKGAWDGPDAETPPSAILASWELDTIVWKP